MFRFLHKGSKGDGQERSNKKSPRRRRHSLPSDNANDCAPPQPSSTTTPVRTKSSKSHSSSRRNKALPSPVRSKSDAMADESLQLHDLRRMDGSSFVSATHPANGSSSAHVMVKSLEPVAEEQRFHRRRGRSSSSRQRNNNHNNSRKRSQSARKKSPRSNRRASMSSSHMTKRSGDDMLDQLQHMEAFLQYLQATQSRETVDDLILQGLTKNKKPLPKPKVRSAHHKSASHLQLVKDGHHKDGSRPAGMMPKENMHASMPHMQFVSSSMPFPIHENENGNVQDERIQIEEEAKEQEKNDGDDDNAGHLNKHHHDDHRKKPLLHRVHSERQRTHEPTQRDNKSKTHNRRRSGGGWWTSLTKPIIGATNSRKTKQGKRNHQVAPTDQQIKRHLLAHRRASTGFVTFTPALGSESARRHQGTRRDGRNDSDEERIRSDLSQLWQPRGATAQ